MSKKNLKDEELLLLARLGDYEAEQLLMERYFKARFLHGRRASAGNFNSLTPLDYNGVFFKAYLNAVNTFRFGRVTFHNYLHMILGREINHQLMSSRQPENYGLKVVRLDTLINESNSDETTFHDIVADEDPMNDPAAYVNYAESLAKLSKLPNNLDPRAIELAKLHREGMPITKAAKKLGVSLHQAKKMMDAFRKFVEDIITHGGKKSLR